MTSVESLRQDARTIFDAGVKAADPVKAVSRHIRRVRGSIEVDGHRYRLSDYRNVYVVGAGKGSAKMAGAVEEMLGHRIAGGIVIVKVGYSVPLRKLIVIEAGHPIPDGNGVRGTVRLMNLLRKTTAEDLVFCLLSGGGSALLTCPAEGLSLRDKRQMTRLLINCGAPIGQINAVRKHMSQVKGGRLAKLIHPASLISLILSDVVGDPIETVASGPTAPDSSTFFDCRNVFDRYGLTREIPRSVAMLIQRGCNGEIEETPKHGDPAFDSARNIIVGNNQLALLAATQEAENLGYRVLVLSESAEGEAADVAVRHVAVAKEILAKGDPIPRPACVLSGGEATVTVTGNGLGGRNQEFALAAAQEIDGLQGVVALSGGTDGTDGPTDAAGGIVDGATIQRAESKRLNARDYLKNNDSYHFLRATDDLLITGPTFTNVMDLRLVLVV